jgi:hypothetical protein
MPFWGEGYGGNLRTMFETIRRPDLYGELVRGFNAEARRHRDAEKEKGGENDVVD